MRKLVVLLAGILLLMTGSAFAAGKMGNNTQSFEMEQGAKIIATGKEGSAGVNIGVKEFTLGAAAMQAGGIHINENLNGNGKMGNNTQTFKMGSQTELNGSSVSINRNINSD